MAKALPPTWFDEEFEASLKQASAEQALAKVAKNPRIVRAVKDALADFEEKHKNPRYMGPTRAQTVRRAIVEVLEARD